MSSTISPPGAKKPITTVAERGIQPRFGELAQDCRERVMNRLAERLGTVFTLVDSTLLTHAEKAENNKIQTLFFDSMRDIRTQRTSIERVYHQQIANRFTQFLEGPTPPLATASRAESLSLIEHEDYEETLLVTNMASRVKARCPQALFALTQRLALLNRGQRLPDLDNPFAPHVIAQAFCHALAPSAFSLRIKSILYSVFEQQVMGNLDELYDDLNAHLIAADILPNLKFSIQNPDETPHLARQAATPCAGSATPGGDAHRGLPAKPTTAPAENSAAWFLGLSDLLNTHEQQASEAPLLGGRSIASFAPRTATHTYPAGELQAALDRLQEQSADNLAQRLGQPQPVESFKVELHNQLEVRSRLPGQQKLSSEEADVVDLVGMLFDFILKDQNLPDSCKTALSHLHTPYLRIALQDRALFTLPQHPARVLLNSLAQAGVLYGGEEDESGLLSKIHWVVEQVLRNYRGEQKLLNDLLEEFTTFVTALRHRIELHERRAIEAAKGRDRLTTARNLALDVITRAQQNRALPDMIRNFLEQTWLDVLVFVLVRHEASSKEWQRVCTTTEQLAWSCTALTDTEQEKLRGLRLTLLEDIRQGMLWIGGLHDDSIRQRLRDIVACQFAAQHDQPSVPAPTAVASAPAKNSLPVDLGAAADLLRTPTPKVLSPRTQALVEQLQNLEFGTWFEFIQGKESRRLKLSWFSPTSHNYMFVDRSGLRVSVKPIEVLAEEIDQGLARILPPRAAAPLVDRALAAIVRVLHRFSGRLPDSTQGTDTP
jgi:hypothetical protein